MFEGFTSRCTSPILCAALSADAICSMTFTARVGSIGPCGKDALEVLPLDQPHVHIQPAFDLAEVVDGDDMWVVQPRRGEGLVPEPLLETGIRGQLRRQDLDRNDTSGGGVECFPHLTHAAPADQLDEAVPAKGVPSTTPPGDGGKPAGSHSSRSGSRPVPY